MFELYRAFRRTETGHAPGPDNLPMETLRLLSHPVKKYLLAYMIVSCWALPLTMGTSVT
jgi:hypothetical protein